MTKSIARSPEIEGFLDQVSGIGEGAGDDRVKRIVRRVVGDLYRAIEDFEVTPDEFWTAVSFLTRAGRENEFGLLAPGLGFDHFLDMRMDALEEEAGLKGGTPRTIEGPLYVAGAPLVRYEARLDDDPDEGETLFMHGRVTDLDGRPVPGAIVEVWHANSRGNYSFFDPTQSPFNLRRSIETDVRGRYRFRSIMPAGYGVPPGGPTERLLDRLGRHGRRPAHIHFLVSAPGYRHLTTQINIAGDPLLHDDFAFATRDDLIPEIVRHDDPEEIRARGLDGPFAEIEFDFVLKPDVGDVPDSVVFRERASGVVSG